MTTKPNLLEIKIQFNIILELYHNSSYNSAIKESKKVYKDICSIPELHKEFLFLMALSLYKSNKNKHCIKLLESLVEFDYSIYVAHDIFYIKFIFYFLSQVGINIICFLRFIVYNTYFLIF